MIGADRIGGMEQLEGLDARALALDGDNLEVLRWGGEQHRFPVGRLEPGTITRDDKRKLFGEDVQRLRVGFGAVATNIWVPLEKQAEAEAFVAAVDAARERAAG
jgi:hypothetical protein